MFRNRRNTQKPDEELYAAFKQSFPEVGLGSSSLYGAPGTARRPSTLSEAIINEPATTQQPFESPPEVKEQDATPKPFTDAWRFTPSPMDPISFAFFVFENQPPGYYTPIPGGLGTLYHPQADDLHIPGMGMNTPLSLPRSVHALYAQDPLLHLQNFNPHLLHQPRPFHDPLHTPQPQVHIPQQQPQTFAPHQFLLSQDSGYVAMDDTPHKSTPTQVELRVEQAAIGQPTQQSISGRVGITSLSVGEKFRFHTTLNALTAIVRHAEEIPITYLNKGQAYTMSIWDTTPPLPQANVALKYRTCVRVSFEDEQQRARPGACWQLWKQGRGSNEAYQRGGKLLAVEYIDPNQGGDNELQKSHVQLEKASFDGFAVTWFPNSLSRGPNCAISIRFNFLSTDFSYSKGVKGIPVRLCAKTELVTTQTSANNKPEVCFSTAKLFRDHGAERKFSNDVAHIKKTINKLKQRIAQAEVGLGNTSKRRRSGSIANALATRPGKVLKHKRTCSADPEAEGVKFLAEEDLQIKLAGMQDIFSSTQPLTITQPLSILFLRGEPEDDPDLYPVKLPGDDPNMKEIIRTTTWEPRQNVSDSPNSAMSPTTSSGSQTTTKRKYSEMQQPAIQEEVESEHDNDPNAGVSAAGSNLVKIPKTEDESMTKSELLIVDVDVSYHPPVERPIPLGKNTRLCDKRTSLANYITVACFYAREKCSVKEHYHAVYLTQRTVKDLINKISEKFYIDPHRVTQVAHINSKGLYIIVDEDVVRELAEGQDMIVEFAPLLSDLPQKHEFVAPTVTDVIVDGEIAPPDISISDPLEIWLNY